MFGAGGKHDSNGNAGTAIASSIEAGVSDDIASNGSRNTAIAESDIGLRTDPTRRPTLHGIHASADRKSAVDEDESFGLGDSTTSAGAGPALRTCEH